MNDLWVLDDAGLSIPTAADLIAQARDELAAPDRLGGDYLFHPEDPISQWIELVAFQLASVYQLAEVLFNSRDPNQAQGVLLRELGSIVGAVIPTATRSTIAGRFLGTPGTLIKRGDLFRYLPTGDLWQTFQEYTIAANGVIDAELESVEFAAVDAPAAPLSSWQVQVPTPGLTGFLSTEPADVGRTAATNAETREAIELAAEGGAGAATYDSDVANVAGVEGVDHVALFVNRQLVYDPALDLLGKTARFVVDGGRKQAIFDAIGASGSTSLNTIATGTVQGVTVRPDGKQITVSYSRPTGVPVLMRVTIDGDLSDAPETVAVVEAAIVERQSIQDFAEPVIPEQYRSAIVAAFGENVVTSCVVEARLDVGDPWVTTPLILGQAERASISDSPRPASVTSVAEDPISVLAGQDITVTVDGGAPQSITLTSGHSSVSSLIEELSTLTDVQLIDDDGRFTIRTESEGASSELILSGTLLVALGIPAATYDGADSDITVVIV